MKTAVVVNLSKEEAISCAGEISLLMLSNNSDVFMLSECAPFYKGVKVSYTDTIEDLFRICDIAITVGGDGTIIHAAKYAARFDKPLIGVNVGRLGFAADIEIDGISELTRILDGDYSVEERVLFDVEVIKNGVSKNYLAVNDAVIARGQLSKIIDLQVTLDNEEIAKYRADGLLFSTPTGSTAYSLSAGGPIIAPQLDCILMTPVCPHSLFSRSVIFEGNSVLTVSVKIPDECCCVLTIDGEKNVDILADDIVKIKKSDLKLKFVSINKRNFYRKLNEKLKEREI